MHLTTEQFNTHLKSVIDWNAVARNFDVTFSQEDILRQTEYTAEEVFETISALALNDTIEVIDGICDTFVTLAYKYYQITGKAEFEGTSFLDSYEVLSNISERNLSLIVVVVELQKYNLFATTDEHYELAMDSLHQTMRYMTDVYTIDMNEAMTEVMDSNWSKFPEFDDTVDYESECSWIEHYRKKTNVKHSVVDVNGIKRVVFRDDGGTGKVCKPSTFKEPDLTRLM